MTEQNKSFQLLNTATETLLKAGKDCQDNNDQAGACSFLSRAIEMQLLASGVESLVDKKVLTEDEKAIALIELIVNKNIQGRPLQSIVGLKEPINVIMRTILMPLLHPEHFAGTNELKSMFLLYGLPGVGKTEVIKAIVLEVNKSHGCAFLEINAGMVLSKWLGESEKMANAVFDVAIKHKPCILFIDEIEQLLSKRSNESEGASNRVKAAFLTRLWGELSGIVVLGCSNKPQDIDDAFYSRFTRAFYVPLPNALERRLLFQREMRAMQSNVLAKELDRLAMRTDGYSGRDISKIVKYSWTLAVEAHHSLPDKNDLILSYRLLQNTCKIVKPCNSEKSIQKLEKFLDENDLSDDTCPPEAQKSRPDHRCCIT